MDCPDCHAPMVSGSLFIKGTLPRFLLIGLSWQSLWFREGSPTGRMPKERILDWGELRHGWVCRACGMTVVAPEWSRSQPGHAADR